MTLIIKALTLVDITPTGIQRIGDSNTMAYHQQQNLNVLLQTIGLRTQVFDPQVIIHEDADLSGRFSDFFPPKGRVWSLKFECHTDAVWRMGQDELSLLKQDVHGVAITSDLENTVEFPVNIFDTRDNINTFFITN